MRVWCETLVTSRGIARRVEVEVAADGRIVGLTAEAEPGPDSLRLGVVLPGMVNAHSHAFHRLLRGTTHGDGGDFWNWREGMYTVAAALDPPAYREVARAVFAEMLCAGWTSVGEFHYLHHTQDGTPYGDPAHAMELALAEAASSVGIRLVLLDSCYLAGDVDTPLAPRQRRFSDGDAARWLERWHALRAALAPYPGVELGASIHSVRAVPADQFAAIRSGLPPEVPLHIHVSEQRRENEACLARYGLTPTGLLAEHGLLDARTSLVHATHLTDDDRELIAAAGATVVMCPTTEADLGDGVGPALLLHERGVRIALGSDQNAVVDPFLEIRGLEMGERLAAERRGRFSPAELLDAASGAGARSLGLGDASVAPGAFCDLVEVDARSARTVGSAVDQLVLTASEADVRRVVVGGRVVADRGILSADGADPATLLADALRTVDDAAGGRTS